MARRPEAAPPSGNDSADFVQRFGQLEISSTSEKCVRSTKDFGDKLIQELQPHLIECKDQLKNDINTTVVTEYYKRERNVNIRRIPNPYLYAMHFHEEYMGRVPERTKIVFVGMNPSSSSLTGIPFYEDDAMTNLFGEPLLTDLLKKIPEEYRNNATSESGQRIWRFVVEKFGSYDVFFRHCSVMNYSPLIFMDKDDGNVALDGFNGAREPLLKKLMKISDFGFEDILNIMKPALIIGIGWYAYNRIKAAGHTNCFQIDHPSPAANDTYEEWIEKVDKKLERSDVWKDVIAQIKKEENATLGPTLRNITKAQRVEQISRTLCDQIQGALAGPPDEDGIYETAIKLPRRRTVTKIINPLLYAWTEHAAYLAQIPEEVKILFVGMNPSRKSPTGIPFYHKDTFDQLIGEVELPRNIINLMGSEDHMTSESTERFWTYLKGIFQVFNPPDDVTETILKHCFVIDCCPLIFMERISRNANFRHLADVEPNNSIMEYCDDALKSIIQVLNPQLIVAIGRLPQKKLKRAGYEPIYMYHPAPYGGLNATYDVWLNHLQNGLERKDAWNDKLEEIRQAIQLNAP